MSVGNVPQVVGNTPLIRIASLSERTGCEIYGKAEFLNPGGSVKDRAALGIILAAQKSGELKPGMTIVEGTAGNTGIGLATLANQMGYKCLVVMPNNQADEKYKTLQALGVELVTVDPVPFANQAHFYHTAKRLGSERPNTFWANQFENLANYEIHYETTGKEIWEQTKGKIDAFVSASGTGGTLAGVSCYLKDKNKNVHVRLLDPMGSGLYEYFNKGELKSEGTSITEGIGIMRLTENFKKARIDDARRINDQEMISMLYHLARHDGLLVGTSAALNIHGAYQWALEHKGSGKTVVGILCDSGLRYQSRVFNTQFLAAQKLNPQPI